VTRIDRRSQDWDRNDRYQQLVELAPDSILIHDGERIVLGNAAAVRLAGADSREQLIDLPIGTFLDPPYLKGVEMMLTQTDPSSEAGSAVRDTFRRLDGTEVQVEVRAMAFIDHGTPAAHLVIRDITERLAVESAAHLVEERMQQAQRLEAVGALAGGVAHEVNNMISVVLGFGDFLLRDERMPADCLSDVREIIKAADRAASVTRQLLAFGRRARQRPQVVDLAVTVRTVGPVVARVLGEARKLVLTTDHAPQVWVDPGLLEQVLINLTLNARDAMPNGGTLSLATGEADVTSGAEADSLEIHPGPYGTLQLRDSGTGMEAAVQARIFEPFFTTKPVGQGTGLGLAAAHGILRQHGGGISVTSAPGKGTTFTLYLPIHSADAPAASEGEAPPLVPDRAAAGTVLVVDDEPGVRQVVARSLEVAGFLVLQASDGAEALELIDRYGPPTVVLTDLTMAGIGGAELARRVKVRWPELPILFMSGYSAEELKREGAIGAESQLIEKPFTPDGLVSTVRGVLSQVHVRSLGIE
jgi:PAS domain S-box-containing protein